MRSYLSFDSTSPSATSHMPHPAASSPLTPLILPTPSIPKTYRQMSQSIDGAATQSATPLAQHTSPSSFLPPLDHSPPPAPPQLTSATRWMDVWPGHHTFLLGGRLVLGSSPLLFLVTLALQLASLALFLTAVALPAYPLYCLLPVALLFPLLFASFLAASLSDPGILPPLAIYVPAAPTQPDIDGQTRKWCSYCRLWRARRAKHCKYCHVCVDEFDHHWSLSSTALH